MDEPHHFGGNDFVWDADKAATTWRVRGIWFEHAEAHEEALYAQ